MYIREIVLDGFKTYQNRTIIAGFDPQFNAITGLNGSGKSNILDAIQFLLGSNCKEMVPLQLNLAPTQGQHERTHLQRRLRRHHQGDSLD